MTHPKLSHLDASLLATIQLIELRQYDAAIERLRAERKELAEELSPKWLNQPREGNTNETEK